MREYFELTNEQNLELADMVINPRELNEIIWFSVRGDKSPMLEIARLPAFSGCLRLRRRLPKEFSHAHILYPR